MDNKTCDGWYLQIACLATFLLQSFGGERARRFKLGLTVLVPGRETCAGRPASGNRYFGGGVANRVPSSDAVGGAQQAGASPNGGKLLSELNSSDGRATLVFLGFVSVSGSCSIHTLHARLRQTQRITRYWSCRNIQASGVPGRFQRILVSHSGQGRLCASEQGSESH